MTKTKLEHYSYYDIIPTISAESKTIASQSNTSNQNLCPQLIHITCQWKYWRYQWISMKQKDINKQHKGIRSLYHAYALFKWLKSFVCGAQPLNWQHLASSHPCICCTAGCRKLGNSHCSSCFSQKFKWKINPNFPCLSCF